MTATLKYSVLTAAAVATSVVTGWVCEASVRKQLREAASYLVQGSLKPDSAAPAFRLQNLKGAPVALTDFRGKVVYLDFWYSGCKPCLAEAPAAAKLRQRFAGQDVVFLYISIDIQAELWKRTVAEHGLDTDGAVHVLDPGRYRAANAYQIDGFPTYLIIDRQGRIWASNAPRPSGSAVVKALKQALAAPQQQ